jgi:hypothetical protein
MVPLATIQQSCKFQAPEPIELGASGLGEFELIEFDDPEFGDPDFEVKLYAPAGVSLSDLVQGPFAAPHVEGDPEEEPEGDPRDAPAPRHDDFGEDSFQSRLVDAVEGAINVKCSAVNYVSGALSTLGGWWGRR